MKVFILGGYGKTGYPAIRLLAQSDLVTKIAIAGRNLERAKIAAADIGRKAIAVLADGTDAQQMISLTTGFDIIINAADNNAVLPCIQAAIHNGAHYCDMAWAQILQDAMQYAPAAELAGITAIIATGISPCITNLMGVHAGRQLDEVKQFQIGRSEIIDFSSGRELSHRQWLANPSESAAELLEYKPFLAWKLQMLQQNGCQQLSKYQDSEWVEINPIKNNIEVPLSNGDTASASPYFSGNDIWGTLPCDISKEPAVELWFSPFPPQLDGMLREQALHVLDENADSDSAVNAFYKTIEKAPQRWLTLPKEYTPIAKIWVRALGYKEGRAAQHTCWFTAPMWDVNGYFLTSVALVAAVFKILRGDIKTRGVMLAEKVFEPQSFFDEVVTLLPVSLPNGKLIDEAFEWL